MFERAQTFPCPSCGEIISDRVGRCRHCGAPVEPATARAAAAAQSRVNQACSDASYLKIIAVSMWLFLAMWASVFSVLFNSSFLIMFCVLPLMLARWQWRFGRVVSGDRDFARARRDKNLSFLLWLAALLFAFGILPLLRVEFDPMRT